jgi:hypothetical protein
MSAERREVMMDAVEGAGGFESLRGLVQRFLDEGSPPDLVLEDLSQIRALVSETNEELVLDVMDLIAGWCAPQFKLSPRPSPGSAPPRA